MSRDIAPFGVRMPSELKDDLMKKATENKRSLNAEIVSRLEVSIEQDYRHHNGHEFLVDDYLEAKAEIEKLEDTIAMSASEAQSSSIQAKLEEIKSLLINKS